MCRYATKDYKRSHGCFKCRKAFKKTTLNDYLKHNLQLKMIYQEFMKCKKVSERQALETQYATTVDQIESDYQEKISVCPDCGGVLVNLGMDTKAPQKNNVKEWAILEGMYQMGISFQSCGCQAMGFVPHNISDYKEYLNDHLAHYTHRKIDAENDTSLSAFQRHERASYWQERIDKIKIQLTKTV